MNMLLESFTAHAPRGFRGQPLCGVVSHEQVSKRGFWASLQHATGLQMGACAIVAIVVASVSISAGPAWAGDMPAEHSATAKWMIERARAWAEQACGGKWVISDLLAEDFRGTSPKGARYEKPTGEPAYDPKTQWSTDCRLDDAEVRFFGADVAVVYGAESKTVALADEKHERRCLVWTDTWLRRNGKWQIIAVQDNRIECAMK